MQTSFLSVSPKDFFSKVFFPEILPLPMLKLSALSCSVLVFSSLVFSMLSLVSPAYAQDMQETQEMYRFQEIVVSASVQPSEAKKLPANVQVITKEQMEEAGVKSIEAAIIQLVHGNTMIQVGAFSKIGLRGFRSSGDNTASSTIGDGVLVLIDGLRSGSGNPAAIPFALVERIEVVRGPSSMLYGGSAMGGVLNIITKQGDGDFGGSVDTYYTSLEGAGLKVGISGGYTPSSMSQENKDTFGYVAALGGSFAGDYKDGNGKIYENTKYQNIDGGATFTWRPDNTSSLHTVFTHQSLPELGSPGGIGSLSPANTVSLRYSYISSQYKKLFSNDMSLQASVYGTKNYYEDNNVSRSTITKNETLTLGTRVLGSMSFFDYHAISMGAEYYFSDEKAFGKNVNTPDAQYNVVAALAEYVFNYEDITIIAGIRYDFYQNKFLPNTASTLTTSKSYSSLNWTLGGTWWFMDWLGVKASAGTAFVPPASYKLLGNYSTSWGGTYKGNPNLKPESSISGEIGLELDYNGFMVELTYFYTDYIDKITETPWVFGTPTSWFNQDSQKLSGFDLSLSWKYGFGNVFGQTVTFAPYANAELFTLREDSDGKVPTNIPELSAIAGIGLGYSIVWFDLNARYTGLYMGGYPLAEIGSFLILNASISAQVLESLKVYANVYNLTNEFYAYNPGYPMPGINFNVGLNYTF